MAISKELITEIKNSVNIVDVIGEVVNLTKTGRHHLGLCPFHKEKTPSFNVIEDRQFFHCFGCGKSGDVFHFLEEYQGLSFIDSVQQVAERAGIAVTEHLPRPAREAVADPHHKLYAINADAVKFYHAVLMTTTAGQEAKAYLHSRGVTDDIMVAFQLGLAPNEADYLYQAMAKKYDEETLMQSGLFHLSETNQVYDSFRQRIMFPLLDDRSRPIGFSGRVWTDEDLKTASAKYKNTRATPIFNKSYELYHLDKAKSVAHKTHEIYIMEGFMDVIAAYRAGIVNAVASMGTALTPEHIAHLKKFTKKVVLTYDGDKAGQRAIAKVLEGLSDLQVEIVHLPEKMDPDEFLQKHSEEDLSRLLKQSRISSTEFWIRYWQPENSDNLQAQITYVDRLAPLIARVPSITAQNTYIHQMADLLPDFNYEQIEQTVNNERLKMRGQMAQPSSAPSFSAQEWPTTKALSALVRAENHLLHRLLHHPNLLNQFRHREDFVFQTPELETLYQCLKQTGEISSLELSQFAEEVRQAYYRVLEEQLPEELTNEELRQLEKRLQNIQEEKQLRLASKQVRDLSHHGDIDRAVEELNALIAHKRQME